MKPGQALRTIKVELEDRRFMTCETDLDALEEKWRLVEVSEDSESEDSDEEVEEEAPEEDVEVTTDEAPVKGKGITFKE